MKIGIIGFGSIGKRHADNLTNLGHQCFLYDPAYPNGAHVRDFEVKPLAAAMDGIDGYVIASPTKQHAMDIAEYCQTGKPLFVEKPIVHDGPVERLPEQVKMVGYNLRYHACVERAKEWLIAGDIGVPLWGNFTVAQFNAKPDYRRDGVTLNWSHEIDLALYLLGPADVAASSVKLENGHDTIADICLVHRLSDARSVVHLDYHTKPEIRQGIIAGTGGQIIFDLVNRHAWLRDPHGNVVDSLDARDSFDMNYREEMADFINLIEGKASGVHCTLDEALAVLDICMSVRRRAGL